jgi:hypothetical protein
MKMNSSRSSRESKQMEIHFHKSKALFLSLQEMCANSGKSEREGRKTLKRQAALKLYPDTYFLLGNQALEACFI